MPTERKRLAASAGASCRQAFPGKGVAMLRAPATGVKTSLRFVLRKNNDPATRAGSFWRNCSRSSGTAAAPAQGDQRAQAKSHQGETCGFRNRRGLRWERAICDSRLTLSENDHVGRDAARAPDKLADRNLARVDEGIGRIRNADVA